MKKSALLICTALLTSTLGWANEKPKAKDSFKIVIGDSVVIKISEHEEEKVVTIKGLNKKPEQSEQSIFKTRKKTEKKPERFSVSYLMMDVGINGLHDKTAYNAPAAANFVRVESQYRNENFMGLKAAASRNFNLWPVMVSFNASKSKNQRILLSSGIGVQWYNFKFNNPVEIVGGLDPHIARADFNFSKNKLGLSYLSAPLMLTGQTRITGKKWLTYGVGVIGGYRLQSWTKQKSSQEGKMKERDPFNMEPFQWSLTAEIGVTNILRLYGTYQMTNMWKSGIQQQPFAIGIRLFGI